MKSTGFFIIKNGIAFITVLLLIHLMFPAVHGNTNFAYAEEKNEAVSLTTSSSVSIDDFENGANLYASSVRANAVSLTMSGRPGPVRNGYRSGALAYDFAGTIGTSAAYIHFKDADGSTGRTLEASPQKLGMWIYGDGNNHWLRAQLQDASGKKTTTDFTGSGGLSWVGWKYVTASVPAGMMLPIKLTQIYIVETNDNNKNGGILYFDRLTAFYADLSLYALDFQGLTPMKSGDTLQAKVYGTYSGSTEPVEVTGRVVYASSNPTVATIDESGLVKALQPGTTTISATTANAPKALFSLTVTAEAPMPQSIELSASATLTVGETDSVKVFAAYPSNSEPVEIVSGVSYQSSNPEVAAIDTTGKLKAMKDGEAVITVSFGGRTSSYTLTVNKPVPILQKIELAQIKAMNVGQTQQAKVAATYSMMNEPVDVTGSSAYKSSNPEIARVDSTGTVTALKVGATRITASFGGKSSDKMLVVNQPTATPKRELRAAWIASVENIDWPKKGVVTPGEQKRDFSRMLDELQALGMNAVIVQVKPTADAFYPSMYGPWSEWLTGVQGQDPGYDPLAFMVEEAHKRNLEFHAWFNPYRVSMQDRIDKLVAEHPARQHPDWVVAYGGRLLYNPGIPAVKDFVIGSVLEVVKNYDIDGVHMDDYFYPYPAAGVDFPDEATYRQYGEGIGHKADWRRNNVNRLVQELSTAIHREKSHVKFGISPFGIWRNKTDDPTGSDTNGLRNYDDLYADTRTWIQQGWLDYIAPQIYWNFGYSPAAYEKLIDWWTKETQGKNVHLYIGQAPYRIGSADPAWQNPDELPNQLVFNRNFETIRGSMFFSAKDLLANALGFGNRLKQDLYPHQALIPAMPWLDAQAPAAPVLQTAVRQDGGIELSWECGGSEDESYYVVYRFEGKEVPGLEHPEAIVASVRKIGASPVHKIVDPIPPDGKTYTYVVTASDRLHNESAASNQITVIHQTDRDAPVTTAKLEGERRGGWFISDVTLKLTAADAQSGIERTEYSLNGGSQWQLYREPLLINKEGSHTVAFRSVDKAGNMEPPQSVVVSIDKTPPLVQMVGTGGYTVDQRVLVVCTATDTVSGIVYSSCGEAIIDQPAYRLPLGTGTVTATAQDQAGHTTVTSATYTVQVTYGSLANVTRQLVTGPGGHGIVNSLVKKLEHKQPHAYIREVSALRGKKIPAELGDLLIRLAQALN